MKSDGWDYWGFNVPSVPADDIDPSSVSYADVSAARLAFLASPGVLLDELALPPDDCLAIAAAISDGTAASVSDGSFDGVLQRGSSAFIISPTNACTNALTFITGGNLTTGNPADQSAYRSELAGALAILSTVDLLVSYYKITSGSLTIAFDGEAALREASKTSGLSVSQPCFDYLQVIHNKVAALPIDIHWRWVRGHQREQDLQDIDWWGKMNDLVDSKAKDFLTVSCRGHRPKPLYFSKLFHEPWTISLLGLKQPSLNRTHCYETLFKPRIHRYWEGHHDTPLPSSDNVDWAPSSKAIKRLSLGLRRWRWKFSTGCIGVGNQLFHRNHQPHSKCPLCQSPNEKVSHVLHCPDRAATTFATARIQHHLSDELEALDTEPILSSAILDIILSWRRGESIVSTDYAVSIRPVILEQCSMGWDNFVLGRWCPSWQHHQASHYADIGSRRTSLRWATALIRKLLLVSWDL